MNTPAKNSKRRTFDFISKRRIFGAISAVAVIVSMILLVVPGPNYGIDFAGGTNIIASFTGDVSDEELRDAVEGIGLSDASVQNFAASAEVEGAERTSFLIRTREISTIDEAQIASVQAALTDAHGDGATVEYDEASGDRVYVRLPRASYGVDNEDVLADTNVYAAQLDERVAEVQAQVEAGGMPNVDVEAWGNPSDRRFLVRVQTLHSAVADAFSGAFGERFVEIDRIESVGPRVGDQLRSDSIKAVLIALLAILFYIAIRFDVRYAPGAVVALFHDVIITLGVFVIVKHEISLPIVAALLTIVGYSLNDTIVNFDRIRENIQLTGGKADLKKLVNRSLNESLSRTILTSVTTAIALIAIFALGGGLIRDFAFAMLLGVGIGTYSSIFVASPVMIWMSGEVDRREAARAAREPATPRVQGPTTDV